jgi:Domain of unknown function (DUF4082)
MSRTSDASSDTLPSASTGGVRHGRRPRHRGLVKKAVIASAVLSLPAAALGLFSDGDNVSVVFGTQSLWSATVPGDADSRDSASVNVGMRFHTTVAGQILGVRFYKGAANIGTHVGSLWSASGTLLGSVIFTNEAPTGWQAATFATPISIAPSTTYEVSYLAPHGHYAFSDDYFKTAYQSGDLIADQTTSQYANGVYRYSSGTAAPVIASPHGSNYWVDVLFRPSSTSPSRGTASAASGSNPSPFLSPGSGPSSRAGTSPVGGYVRPGTVGYLGSESALTVYQPGGAVPGGCSWQAYGLRCNQRDLALDHVWIKGSFYWTGTGRLTISQSIVQGGTGDSWYAVLGHPATPAAIDSTIEVTDSTVGWLPGRTMPAGEDVAPIWSVYGNQVLVAIRDDLSGMPQGIDPTAGSVIQDNWIHGLVQSGTADAPVHLDGIFSQGGSDITIEGNYVDAPVRSDTTAAIYIQHRGGTDAGISIVGNYLNGGAYNLRNQTGIDVDVRNNTFGNSVWGAVGDLTGYPGTYGTWTGNITLDRTALTAP